MFTKAGFNPRRVVICYAAIWLHGLRWPVWSRLVRFCPANEYAWDGGGGRVSWPERAYGTVDLIAGPPVGVGLKQSRLPQ